MRPTWGRLPVLFTMVPLLSTLLLLFPVPSRCQADPQPTVMVFTSNAYDGVARAEDAVTLRFDAGEVVIPQPSCGFPGLRRAPKATSDFGGRRWTCVITVDPLDRDGPLEFSGATEKVVDGAGKTLVAGISVSSTTLVARESKVQLRVDNTAPAPSSLAIISSGERPLTVNVGEVATLNYVAAEVIAKLEVAFTGIAASRVTVVGSGQSWQAFFTARAGDPTGTIAFTASATDLAGNVHVATTAPQGPAEITSAVDSSPPQVESVTLASSHEFNTSYAVVGTVMTLTMKFRESVGVPEVTVLSSASGNAKMSVTGLVDTYVGTYTVSTTDKQGPFSFVMQYRDGAGNIGTPVSKVTAGPTAVIDTVRPTISAVATGSNPGDPKILREGEILTIQPAVFEPLLSLTVTVRGLRLPAQVTGSGNLWVATARAGANDTEGEITYQIDATDFAGNAAQRYSGKGPIRPVCGTGVEVEGEICDGDARCTANCTCRDGFFVDPSATAERGKQCRAGSMIAIVDVPVSPAAVAAGLSASNDAGTASTQLREYAVELWENAHEAPLTTFPTLSSWLALPSSTGPVRTRALRLAVSTGWSACTVKPEIGHTGVNLSYVVVEGPSSLVPSRVTAASNPPSPSTATGAAETRIAAAAYFSNNADGYSVWDRVLRAASGYAWAEPDGFTLNGTSAVAVRFPNSTSSPGMADADRNTFARFVLGSAGVAWPAAAPIGDTERRARISPRNRIDFYCNSAPTSNASVPCADLVGANNANASVQTDACNVIVPLISMRIAQIAPPITATAFAKELALATGIDDARINVRTVAVLPAGSRRARGRAIPSTTRTHTSSTPSGATVVRSRSAPSSPRQSDQLPVEDPKAPTVLVEFSMRETTGDPLGLEAMATVTRVVDAVDQSPLRRRRIFVRDYNVEDLTRRPPVDEPDPGDDPNGGSGSGTSRVVWIVVIAFFACVLIALAVWLVIRRKKQVEMAKQAQHDDRVADAQFNEFPWKEGGQGGDRTLAPGELPDFGDTRRKLTAQKGKLTELPMISFAKRVKDKERRRAMDEGPGGIDDLEFTSQSLTRGNTTPPPPLSSTRGSSRSAWSTGRTPKSP